MNGQTVLKPFSIITKLDYHNIIGIIGRICWAGRFYCHFRVVIYLEELGFRQGVLPPP